MGNEDDKLLHNAFQSLYREEAVPSFHHMWVQVNNQTFSRETMLWRFIMPAAFSLAIIAVIWLNLDNPYLNNDSKEIIATDSIINWQSDTDFLLKDYLVSWIISTDFLLQTTDYDILNTIPNLEYLLFNNETQQL